MFDWDPAGFSLWDWWLYGFAAYACGGLVWFWFRFHVLERAAHSGMEGAIARYNRALKGFPNSILAKRLGKRALEERPNLGARVVHAIRRR